MSAKNTQFTLLPMGENLALLKYKSHETNKTVSQIIDVMELWKFASSTTLHKAGVRGFERFKLLPPQKQISAIAQTKGIHTIK